MPRIVLLNLNVTTTRAIYRQLWMVEKGDVLVSPISVDESFLAYVRQTLGLGADDFSLVVTRRELTDAYLGSAELARTLRALLVGAQEWELLPCAFTPGVADLAVGLGLPVDAGLRFAAQRGPELLNRKSHFRQIAAGAGLPIAEGMIAVDADAIAAGVRRYLARTGTVIVKRDDDQGGMGNIALTQGDPVPVPGVRETRRVEGDLARLAATLWDELTDGQNVKVVVESYYAATDSFYAEYLIGADGKGHFLNNGSIRRTLDAGPASKAFTWVGLEIPADLPPAAAATFATVSAQMVELSGRLGYRGYLNIDALLTPDGELICNEVNGRWGGSLALHTIGRRLLGERYADRHVVSSLRDVAPLALGDLLRTLHRDGLLFSPETSEGVVVVAVDELRDNTTECVVLGPSRPRVRQIEARLSELAHNRWRESPHRRVDGG